MRVVPLVLLALSGAIQAAPEVAGLEQAGALYEQHCQSCHGVDRLGGAGPALLPESLSRLKPDEAREVIHNGRPASQMAAFGDRLNDAQIDGLVSYLYQPPATPPTWSDVDIRASHRILADVSKLPSTPQHGADPLNLFVVVEAGNHHVRVLDGERFTELANFPSHYALHGGPKFSPDGRFVYFASRDGVPSAVTAGMCLTSDRSRASSSTRLPGR